MTWLVVSLMVVIVILLALIAAILNYGFAHVYRLIVASTQDNRKALENVSEEIRDIDRRIERLTSNNEYNPD